MIMNLQCSGVLRCLLMLLLAHFAADGAHADDMGWRIEQGVDVPSYAVVESTSTDLNIDAVALACEEAGSDRILQLQLYLSDDGPLRPKDALAGSLKEDPRAEISIDGHVFPVALLFADVYAVLADAQDGPFPLLSDRLLEAMQTGKKMAVRFDLLAERAGEPARFDGEAVIDLQRGGRQAVAAMRRCAGPANALGIGTAQLQR
jgi:hypothetical protein